ncbi:hypothetical protein GCM10011403_26600 [Pseudohongiella nitratireducens]|uniref:FlgO domain-containing protein n=1 Tax=Pseudohongiella nitratireducens TaxID=1768907 RepID=A0A916VJW5_9GAMM|nr:FlgO family outer membrane protein [Pseudohongiella nitratireducens]GFZ81829.1 hypothetical protein GCM10011403_26600 [Pseudohongiella nitratireducens]|tara:strand:- start:8136 stop:8672 length:537 start_codon:yes stop_codon:yes gene_type:complete
MIHLSLRLKPTCLLLAVIALTACGGVKTSNNRVIASHHDAARYLITMAGQELQPGARMIAASFADINHLEQSSNFGRMATQHLVSQFTLQGYDFVEMLLRKSVYIDASEGEFLLSRELNEISQTHNAPIVLVGTYAVAGNNVFVTAKLVRSNSSVIVASYDYAIPITRDMRDLLRPPF